MIATSKKIFNPSKPENACPDCNGVGKIRMVPYGQLAPFDSECSNCLGEKIITPELVERKEEGAKLRNMLHENDLTIREASKKFNEEFRNWNDAVQGRLQLAEIQKKLCCLEQTK